MAHESLSSYYTNNFHVLFHVDIGLVNRFTLDDLENMLPYEREIYLALMKEKIDERSQKK